MSLEQVIQEDRDCSKTELDRLREENERLQLLLEDAQAENEFLRSTIQLSDRMEFRMCQLYRHAQELILSLSERLYLQSELLTQKAEKHD